MVLSAINGIPIKQVKDVYRESQAIKARRREDCVTTFEMTFCKCGEVPEDILSKEYQVKATTTASLPTEPGLSFAVHVNSRGVMNGPGARWIESEITATPETQNGESRPESTLGGIASGMLKTFGLQNNEDDGKEPEPQQEEKEKQIKGEMSKMTQKEKQIKGEHDEANDAEELRLALAASQAEAGGASTDDLERALALSQADCGGGGASGGGGDDLQRALALSAAETGPGLDPELELALQVSKEQFPPEEEIDIDLERAIQASHGL